MEITWQIEVEQSVLPPAMAMASDERLLDEVAGGKQPATARIWRTDRSLVVPHAHTSQPRFDEAADSLARAGWPVVLRGSGGSPVPLDRGTVNLSLVFPVSLDRGWQIDDGFRLLTETLIAGLAKLGFAATCGRVPDAFCAGRFDLALGGRKIAGTAQRWRAGQDEQGQRRHAVLAHAALLVASDLEAGIAVLNQWSHLLGGEERHDVTQVTSLLTATKATMPSPDQLISLVIAVLRQQLQLNDDRFCTARRSWAAL